MSDKNKYRYRRVTEHYRLQTEARPRAEAIQRIASALAKGWRVTGETKFDNKQMSPEHHKALLESARLWNKLKEFETVLKNRTKTK